MCIDETPATASITPLELSSTPDRLSPVGKKSTVPRRVAVLSESESSKERVDSTEISSTSGPKVTVRSVIPHSSERKSDDSSTTQSRLVVNRNVVLAEPVSSPSRKIVQSMTPTRVVLASTPAPSPSSKLKRNETKADKLTEQENKSKKFKSESRSSNSSSLQASESEYKVSIDISTPRAIANRRSLTVGDQASPNNETTTPSRLNRQPMTKRSSGNLSKSVSTPLIDQKVKEKRSSKASRRLSFSLFRHHRVRSLASHSLISSSNYPYASVHSVLLCTMIKLPVPLCNHAQRQRQQRQSYLLPFPALYMMCIFSTS